MSTLPQITLNSFTEVDAREIKAGDIIDRGRQGVILLRVVESAFQTTTSAKATLILKREYPVTRIVYRKLGEGALTEIRISQGGKIRRLVR
jgi:hypothetical protein